MFQKDFVGNDFRITANLNYTRMLCTLHSALPFVHRCRGKEQAKFWGSKQFWPNCPKRAWNICVRQTFHEDQKKIWTAKKELSLIGRRVFSRNINQIQAYFFQSQMKVSKHVCPTFLEFCSKFHGFLPDFPQINTVAMRLHPQILHHCFWWSSGRWAFLRVFCCFAFTSEFTVPSLLNFGQPSLISFHVDFLFSCCWTSHS